MTNHFFDIAFTPAVRAEQERRGSRAVYANLTGEESHRDMPDHLLQHEAEFIAARDSFYLATVMETGWPYIQHRGGPPGFVKLLDDATIGWAEFVGNRQYVSAGNATIDERVAIFFMDYPNKRRLKLLGHLKLINAAERPDLAQLLVIPGYKARLERLVLVTVEAFDWNCPQHITPRFSTGEVDQLIEPMRLKIAQLEAQLAANLQQQK